MAWKELRLPVAEYLAETRHPRLTPEQQGRLALAWPAVWIADDASEAAWRKALCYTAQEWPAAREAYADVLERPDGRWSLPWMEREALRQKAFRDQQAEYGRKGGLAKASRALGEPSEALGSARVAKVTPSPASASASEPTPSCEAGASRNGRAVHYSAEFEAFWEAYRCERRTGKPQAYREWVVAGGAHAHGEILKALEAFKGTSQWKGGFMPEPVRWLKRRPWEDGPAPREDESW